MNLYFYFDCHGNHIVCFVKLLQNGPERERTKKKVFFYVFVIVVFFF